MSESNIVKCAIHGPQNESFVCEHIAESLDTRVPVGFHWAADSEQLHPDAWCSACDDAWNRAGGKWTTEVGATLNVKLICGACYDEAKSIWEHVRKAMH